MNRVVSCVAATVALSLAASLQAPRAASTPAQRLPQVVVETPLGPIEIEVDSVRAPVSAANFLAYVDAGAYDGGRFHRTVTPANQPNDSVRIEVIQGGGNPARAPDRRAPIPLERTSVTGLQHRDGTLSMARGGPDSAIWDFFICIGDQPALDFGGARNRDGQGFAAFGRVVNGMDVVRRIKASAATRQSLTPPIPITRMRRK